MGDFLKFLKELSDNPNVLRIGFGFGAGWIAKEIFDKNDNNGNSNHNNKRIKGKK